jgi:geranylgeranyl diphosphate synthase type II
MHSIDSLQFKIARAFDDLVFPAFPAELYDPVAYTLKLGGKRLRPLLVLASCDLFGGNPDEAIDPAIGIELFHNFTLLHDDLMDQAPLRRGKETVFKKWNANIAILSGDTMFALANKYMLKSRPEISPALIRLLNETAVEVCEGQQYDMNFESRTDVSLAEYTEMIRLKTAVLVAASLKAGAIIGGADEDQAAGIYEFGIYIGLAFQLMDDLLDVYASKEKFGKQTGGDIISGKKTFLILKALDLIDLQDASHLQQLYQSTSLPEQKKVSLVKEKFDQLGIQEITRKEINKYWDLALKAIQKPGFPDEAASPLLSYCAALMDREN